MKKYLILSILTLLMQSEVNAQNENDRAYIIERTNTVVLNEISERTKKYQTSILKRAEQRGVKKEILNSNNKKGYLSGFDINGKPVYDFEDNINVAKTSRVNRIWEGGSSGLNLDGSGIEIGHWEAGGLALTTHQELAGKITHAENTLVSSHATHTACTMVGTGIVNEARGAASGATIVSRRSNFDEFEIATFGAAGGILSNHSYSTGNPNGDIALYGVYSFNAREWDEILYNAPFLTLCKSAGNDRDDGVNAGDSGYDLVSSVSTAKNLLTIGAVYDVSSYIGPSSVVQSVFSNWGPTDDWRIKPDIVANGVFVYSASNDNNSDYGSKSGTSMSTPSVTGAIALLQEHYHNENGIYMNSAMVKALIIGTADEVGAYDGPDFQNGWGLINAARAAEVISDNWVSSRIIDLSLSNSSTYTTTVEIDGTSPLKLTIAWTDPPGSPVFGGVDNQTPMLLNDLDVRITKDGVTYEPWVLTPSSSSDNFADAAVKGDNFRDNVEQIDVDGLPNGIYTVTVTHKDNLLNGFQDFSMVITGILETALNANDLEENKNSILIYPNPSEDGYLNISIPNEYNSNNYNVEIYDLDGKLRKSGSYNGNQINIDASNLNSGLFILKVEIDGNVFKQLIVINMK